MNTFYNTTNESGEQLKMFKRRAKSQQDIIFEFMQKHFNQGFTAFDIHSALFTDKTPVTSVRRSLSNLMKEGLILKTNMKVIQKYGMINHKYIYNQNKTV